MNTNGEFVGCGRYLTTRSDDPALVNGYTVAHPNVGHLSKITTAASLLAKESFDSESDVYECKDEPSIPYLGDSMGLAYLLALIHRSRITVWERDGQTRDVWCTGSIDVPGDKPLLNNVYRNLFTVKLHAFLTADDADVFIVPVANIESGHRQLCRDQHVTMLSLEASDTLAKLHESGKKALLLVHGHELENLIQAVFIPPQPAAQSPSLPSPILRQAARHIDFDVFCCYAEDDRAALLSLAGALRDCGLKLWLEHEQIEIGDPVRDTLEQGLQRSRFLLVCLSRHFMQSRWRRADYEALLRRIATSANAAVLAAAMGRSARGGRRCSGPDPLFYT